MKKNVLKELDRLMTNYPDLLFIRESVLLSFELLARHIVDGGTIYLCGNGGSAADCEHIVGELMKGFKLNRKLSNEELSAFETQYGERGLNVGKLLQHTIKAVSLCNQIALVSAYGNDVNYDYIFAQEVYGYCDKKDILWVISTSGESSNIINAIIAAKIKDASVLGMTGNKSSQLEAMVDVCIKSPYIETDRVQESHICIYHCLCAMLEANFYD